MLAWHKLADGSPDAYVFGQYHDHLSREGSGWKIAERCLFAAGESGFHLAWQRIARGVVPPRRSVETDGC